MFSRLHYFESAGRHWAVALPFDLDTWIGEWERLRHLMIRAVPEPFTRDEWAYLIAFLDPDNLRLPFRQAFGTPNPSLSTAIQVLARPRGLVAVWLPNNVSLLGPLTLILISLTGSPVRLKAGSQVEDLAAAFVHFARDRLSPGPLATYLQDQVRLERFDRDDPRNRALAAAAASRIIFGSDDAVAAINVLPHPVDSIATAFSDRQSEAWIEPSCASDDLLATLVKVFAIYGQAGCTSPRRVVLLHGSLEDAGRIRERLVELWLRIMTRDAPLHIASQNVMARQWAAAAGWDAQLAPRHGAVVTSGSLELAPIEGMMFLAIVPSSPEEAARRLPTNIQTIGHAVTNAADPRWLELLAATRIKRFVPLARMHHFGPVWDGFSFWRQLFEEIEVEA